MLVAEGRGAVFVQESTGMWYHASWEKDLDRTVRRSYYDVCAWLGFPRSAHGMNAYLDVLQREGPAIFDRAKD